MILLDVGYPASMRPVIFAFRLLAKYIWLRIAGDSSKLVYRKQRPSFVLALLDVIAD